MSDLISRDKAVAAVLGTSIEYQLIYGKKEPKEGFVRSLIKSIANIPQEEPEPKHGKWIEFSPKAIYECSLCHKYVATADIEADHFCPYCGAKMEADHE